MKAVEFKEQNLKFAENQDEYENLPARAENNGIVTFCMEFDEEELKILKEKKVLHITRLTFKGPVQPIKVSFTKPKFPVSYKGLGCVVSNWTEDGQATTPINITPIEMRSLQKNKRAWITTATFGSPLQPISMSPLKPE